MIIYHKHDCGKYAAIYVFCSVFIEVLVVVLISISSPLFICVYVQACQLLLQQQPQQQQQQQAQILQNQRKFPPNVRQQADPQQVPINSKVSPAFSAFSSSSWPTCFVLCAQLARIMAVLQQQRQQQQAGGLGGSSKLSPSHHGGIVGGGAKLPGTDPLSHPGLAGSVADLHQKNLGPYSGLSFAEILIGSCKLHRTNWTTT